MNSEKVKEIKKALEFQKDGLAYIENNCVEIVYCKDILTLINELESENERLVGVIDIANEREYRKKFNDEWRKEYQKELDKQGNGHIAGYPDFDLVYKLYFEQKDRIAELEKENERLDKVDKHYQELIENGKLIPSEQLKQFAERLKRLYSPKTYIEEKTGYTRIDELIKVIDETLKKFINKGDEER